MDTIPISIDLLKYACSGVATAIAVIAAFRDHIVIREKTRELSDIASATIFKEVDKVLGSIVEEILVNYRQIADEEWPAMRERIMAGVSPDIVDKFFELQLDRLETIVHDTFFGRIRSQTIQNIQINSYHEKSHKELEDYYREVGEELYSTVITVLRSKGIDRVMLLNNRIGEKYKAEDAIEAYKCLIEFVLRVEEIRDGKIEQVKKERSLLGKVLTIIKGLKNG